MGKVQITDDLNYINIIKKNNVEYKVYDKTTRDAVKNIQISLDNNFVSNSNDNYSPAENDTFQIAIQKLYNGKLNNDDVNSDAIDWSKKYLTFEALEAGTFTFTSALNYSLDGGSTWTALAANTATPSVAVGNEICFKASLTPSTSGIGTFSATGNFNAKGNPMSLIFGDNFVGQTSLSGKDYAFFKLFYENTKLISAEYLSLPATTLSTWCYGRMFQGCTSLTTAPELPATTLKTYCYEYMFAGCTSLTTAPELPATILAQECYYCMFRDCTSLTTAPELPATTLADHCYCGIFYGCTSLTTAPSLPATTLTTNCYQYMFYCCTSLTTAPSLPATTLTADCYQDMFNGCTSLTVIPSILPALTVPSGSSSRYGCYQRMFKDCTSLTSSPIISATTIGEKGMSEMFKGCTNLSRITCLATDISATNCTENWVDGVAASGTFVKNDSATWDVTGTSGIPSGWTTMKESESKLATIKDLNDAIGEIETLLASI